MKIVEEEGLMDIWPDMAQKASEYYEKPPTNGESRHHFP